MSMIPIIHVEAASTLAVVVSSNEPLLFLSDDLKVIAASTSFCRNFNIDPATIPGRRLGELGNGEWDLPNLASLLRATISGIAPIEAYEIDLIRPNQATRNLVVNARTLDDGDKERVRMLLAVTDVTTARAEAREKDDLIRDKQILIQEVQHRVANSLQIIASVLMQSARRVQSEEARGHLHNAHHRVMSIAAVQRQLSTSKGGSVELRTYLTQLCESLGASMISDPDRLSIDADEAIRILESRSDIDLVFTDVQMPGSMDGIKLAHYIRERWPPVKLILASGNAILEESILPTGSGFFAKPYVDHAIMDTMASMLAAPNEHTVVVAG